MLHFWMGLNVKNAISIKFFISLKFLLNLYIVERDDIYIYVYTCTHIFNRILIDFSRGWGIRQFDFKVRMEG